jgi:hypothetical protein
LLLPHRPQLWRPFVPLCETQGKPESCFSTPLPELEALLHLFVRGLLTARIAKLLRLQPLGMLLFVFCRRVVTVFTVPTLQRDDFPHV